MTIKSKIQEFNKRWSITDNSSHEEEFKKFKTRVLNSEIFSDIDSYMTKGIMQFCQTLGVENRWEEGHNFDLVSKNIINALVSENNEKRFYRLLQIILCLPMIPRIREILFRDLAEAIEYSNINLAITVKDDELILYPHGEKELDEKLVNEVLIFLNTESQKHFIEALHIPVQSSHPFR